MHRECGGARSIVEGPILTFKSENQVIRFTEEIPLEIRGLLGLIEATCF